MPREIVRADFEALFRQYADKAVKRFNMMGKHPPQIYGVKLGKEPGQVEKSFSLNMIAPMFFDGSIPKDNIRVLLQDLTTPGSEIRKLGVAMGVPTADVVVQINEAWFTARVAPPGITREEFDRLHADDPPPSRSPDRMERIAIFLHAYQYTTMGLCPIVAKPKRHAEMGALEPEDGKFIGRMSMTIDDGSAP
jgi:hypothetical protein